MSYKEPNFLCLDFEFSRITHENVNLVSCVTYDLKTKVTKRFWLHNSQKNKDSLAKHLKNYTHIMGYACVAEARCFYALNLNPLSFKWVDLFLEYRMLTNHNDRLNWGKQLVDGKVRTFSKPKNKWERTEEESRNGFKATHSLAEATYKLTGEIRDTDEKDKVRALIISDPKKFTEEERLRILKYNEDDVVFLAKIWKRTKEEFAALLAEEPDWEEYIDDALWRGRYAAHTAIMESVGYPINLEATKNFSNKIPSIIAECQRDINYQMAYDKVEQVKSKIVGKPYGVLPFQWRKNKNAYSWNQKSTRDWLQKNVDTDTWMRTDKGALSLSLEAFEKVFQYKHDYPRGNFGAQIVRYLKLKQSLNGFSTTKEIEGRKKKKNFWDSVGPDGRVRPYMNIYGAQSGRSQPSATSFMFLKAAWMRALVEPAEGYYLAGIDYGQQEFFLAALLSEDEVMIQAYLSGDPYLFMGKQVGAIPADGDKDSHAAERELMKSTTLGIIFGMTKYGLAIKLTADTGQEYTEDEAQGYIDMFEGLYYRYIEWRKEELIKYEDGQGFLTLDGWRLWCDNINPRSVLNVPIQGGGASIMRKAVDLAVDRGCKIIFTLHDAIYLEGKTGREKDILILRDAMRDAFAYYFKGTEYEETAKKIKLDPKAWGPQFPDKGELKIGDLKVPVSRLYIDKRSLADYERFKQYFGKPDSEYL